MTTLAVTALWSTTVPDPPDDLYVSNLDSAWPCQEAQIISALVHCGIDLQPSRWQHCEESRLSYLSKKIALQLMQCMQPA